MARLGEGRGAATPGDRAPGSLPARAAHPGCSWAPAARRPARSAPRPHSGRPSGWPVLLPAGEGPALAPPQPRAVAGSCSAARRRVLRRPEFAQWIRRLVPGRSGGPAAELLQASSPAAALVEAVVAGRRLHLELRAPGNSSPPSGGFTSILRGCISLGTVANWGHLWSARHNQR